MTTNKNSIGTEMKKVLFLISFLFIGFSTINKGVAQVIASGNCGANGNNLTWTLTSDGVLNIEGSGPMANYDPPYFTGPQIPWGSHIDKIKTLSIGNSVTTIGSYILWGCWSVTSISIGNSVTIIGKGAFQKCKNIKSITIPNSVITIDEESFDSCTSLTGTLTIPNSVTKIGKSAFCYCVDLTSVLIGNSVRTIGSQTFYGCEKIKTITIPSSVTTIGSKSFQGCYELTEIIVNGNNPNYCSNNGILYNKIQDTLIQCPAGKIGEINILNSVSTIEEYAFFGCSKITSLIIGNSVNRIGQVAFSYCSGLKSIKSYAIVPPTTSFNTFVGVPKTIPISVPCNSENAYKNASGNQGWKDFTNYTNCINVGLPDFIQTNNITLYPNPASTELHMQLSNPEPTDYIIYNNFGQMIQQGKVQEKATVNIESWANGVYFIRILGAMKKIIKY